MQSSLALPLNLIDGATERLPELCVRGGLVLGCGVEAAYIDVELLSMLEAVIC